MIRALALTPLLAIAACAQPQAAPSQNTPPLRGAGQCDADGLDDLIGKPGTSALAGEALDRSGAKQVRWIQPGQAVTMDYRTDRLDINLDSDNVVTGIKCG